MLKTIYFDLGNVLVFFSHAKMFQQIAECTGLSSEEVQRILAEDKVQEQYESGRIDTAQFYQIFKSRSRHPFSLYDFLEAASDIFTPNTELFSIVVAIKEKGLRLILLSNTSECHFNRVYAHYPVLRLFDAHVLSFEAHALKPSPFIFYKALSLAGCEPACCFYTDDVSEFVAGARKAGLDSELFTGVPSLKNALNTRGLCLE